jgi:hypothetical protein
MSAAHALHALDGGAAAPRLAIGLSPGGVELSVDLGKLMAGRCLVQGSSGAGKSQTLRRIVEEAFEYVTVILVDPEGEFDNLAEHIGATTLRAAELAADGLTSVAWSARRHRLPLHLDLSDMAADERIEKAAAFFAGLIESPRETWSHTVLVVIDEAHKLAPHIAGSARDAAIRRIGVAALTIENTGQLTELRTQSGGVMPARVWQGETESGVPVVLYVVRCAVPLGRSAEDYAAFERELMATPAPVRADLPPIPLRMIL